MRAVDDGDYADAIVMSKVKVEYPPVTILRDLDWTVRRGEKWALLGKNGCGKSTLLSLVCGDNPQGYANDITLFGRKRGTGESIWDIKSHIGYISPDMHTFYQDRNVATRGGMKSDLYHRTNRVFGLGVNVDL